MRNTIHFLFYSSLGRREAKEMKEERIEMGRKSTKGAKSESERRDRGKRKVRIRENEKRKRIGMSKME